MVDLLTSAPAPGLRRFVRLYVQRRLLPGANLNEPVLARLGGLFEFHFAGLYRVPIVCTDRCEPCAPMLVVGPISRHRVHLRADGVVEALTVMFQPHGLYQLFGVPTQRLAEHAEEAHALLGARMTELYEALANAADFPARVRLLDAFLTRCAAARKAPGGPDWHRAFAWFARSPESVRVGDLAAALHTHPRQLERKALDYSGVSLRTMRRVARFARALRMQSQARTMAWTDIAHAAGFYDQTHMIREFRALGGAPPTALLREVEPHHGLPLMLRPNAGSGGV